MSREIIEKQLTDMANDYAALREDPNSKEKRKTTVRKAIAIVFSKYCPLIWPKERVKNAGLEISKTLESVFKSFSPEKGAFINFLNKSLKNAIEEGRKNAEYGSENNRRIQEESASKDAFDKPILDSLTDETNWQQTYTKTELKCFLDELNTLFLKENQKHKPFLSEWLTWKIIETLDVQQFELPLNQLNFYNQFFVDEQRKNVGLNQNFIATRNGLEKDNASHIINRFKAKINPKYKDFLQ